MLSDLKLPKVLALVLLTALAAAAQTGPVVLTSPNGALEFLKAVPASWDETRVLNGVPPKYITIARRRGNEWYLGCITDWDAREFDVPLSFLGSGAYDAGIYSDGANAEAQPKDSVVERRRVDARTVLKLKLAPAGGSAIRFVPVR